MKLTKLALLAGTLSLLMASASVTVVTSKVLLGSGYPDGVEDGIFTYGIPLRSLRTLVFEHISCPQGYTPITAWHELLSSKNIYSDNGMDWINVDVLDGQVTIEAETSTDFRAESIIEVYLMCGLNQSQ